MSKKNSNTVVGKIAGWALVVMIGIVAVAYVASTGPGDLIHPFGPSVASVRATAKSSLKELLEQNSALLGTDDVTVKSVNLRKVSSHKFVGMSEVEYHNLFGETMHTTLPIKVETYGDTAYTSLDLFGDRD